MSARLVLPLVAALLAAGAVSAQHEPAGHGAAAHEAGTQDASPADHPPDHPAGHHGPNYAAIVFNFVLFAGGLTYVLHKPVRSFFRGRRADIAAQFTAAEQAQRESAARLAELDARLSALDGQVQDILARAQEQAAAEREIVLQQARADATRILSQAEAQVSDLEADAVRRLKVVAADLAVEVARQIIEKQLKPEDRNRLFDRTLKGLQKAGA